MSISMLYAGTWTDQTPQFPGYNPTAIVCRDLAGNQVVMVNELGEVWVTNNAGQSWKNAAPVPTLLHTAEIDYGVDTVLIVAGEGGDIYRSTNFGESWIPVPTGMSDIRKLVSDGIRFWAGGSGGMLFFSPDRGLTWTPATISRGPLDIVDIIPTPYGINIAANLDTTAFILADQNTDDIFDPVDSLSNINLTSGTQRFGKLYFAGSDLSFSGPVVILKEDFGGIWGPAIPYFPAFSTSGIADIAGLSDGGDKLWLAGFDGKIYESDPQAAFFNPVYENLSGDYIHEIATTPINAAPSMAWAAGTNGLMLIYDFLVTGLYPGPNDFLDPAMNRFDLWFSSIPDLLSINKGVFIHSSIRGLVPFTAAYNLNDSMMVELSLVTGGSVPGEVYTIILTDMIKELKSAGRFKRVFSFRTSVGSMGGVEFSTSAPSALYGAGAGTANYVTGFFNTDEFFDLATFTDAGLIFYAGQSGGGFAGPVSQPMAGGVRINNTIARQLKKVDINLDGRPDLLLFDQSNYQIYTNNSDAGFSFTAGSNQFTSNLTDVEFASIDNDSTLDMIMLNDSLLMHTGVTEITIGISDYKEPNTGWEQFEVGDIDNDGCNDLMILTGDRELVLRHGIPGGGFDLTHTIAGNFDQIRLGEIKHNSGLELLASEDSIIHLFELSPPWNFNLSSILYQQVEDRIEAFSLADLNGDRNQDIVISTAVGELKVFINSGDGFFEERSEHQKSLELKPSGITNGDFDQNGSIDFMLYDAGTGDFQIVNTIPGNDPFFNFDSVAVESDHVFLRWVPYEPQGDLEYYNIYRTQDTTATPYPLLDIATTNSYTDSIVISGQTYWYIIEAMDIFGMPHLIGQIEVKVPKALFGEVSGVLSDTLAPYIVKNPIEVPPDSLLQIMPGVTILFEENASLTVYGNLKVQGSSDQMVSFISATNDTTRRWNGITISSLLNTDTVSLSWFGVEGAATAFSVQNRAIDVRYAGISRNQIAFDVQFQEGALKAEHIIVHENSIGIQARSNSELNLKNVTIADNSGAGVIAGTGTSVAIKNAIIWDNNIDRFRIKTGPDILQNSAVPLNIQYSTIDSISGTGTVAARNLSRIPPLFQLQQADSMDYLPDPLSATIDAGDPADDFSLEPQPNGSRINQGIYGGTIFATKSFQPQIALKSDTLRLSAQPGQTDTRNLVIRNKGFTELRLDNLELHKPEFNYAASFPQFIQPGDSITFNITFSPPARGTYSDEIYIRSNDPHYPLPGKPFLLAGTGLNRRPRITTAGLVNGVQNVAYRDSVLATDDDGDALTFQPINVPAWMKVAPAGQLSGVPDNAAVGTNIPVVIRAADGFGGFDTLQTTINVQNVNDPPVITTTNLMDAIEDRIYIDTVYAIDVDKDTLRFTGLTLPAWLKVGSDGALTGLPGNDDVGSGIPVRIMVSDNNGTFDTLVTAINVINTNDPPEIKSIPDTVAYTFIPFEYRIDAIDIDKDPVRFSDDSPLFTVDPDSGIIRFTPVIADTGTYKIIVAASDRDTTVTDTFQLRVGLTPLNAVAAPVSTPGDQKIRIDWKQPDNMFYSGTIIAGSDVAPVTNLSDAKVVIDTSFKAGDQVSILIEKLAIAKTYFFTIINYYDAEIRIFSDPAQITATTLAPKVSFDAGDQIIHVPPDSVFRTALTVKNEGGGTLLMRFSYISNIFNERWFKLDTTAQVIPPFTSLNVAMELSPQKSMREVDHTVAPVLLTNEPGWVPLEKRVVLKILFDKFAPRISMISEPDTIHSYTALHFEYTANDTVDTLNWKFGYPLDSLRVNYRFSRITVNGDQLLKQEAGLPVDDIDFYPLPDGLYRFDLWVFDPDSNGMFSSPYTRRVLISSSTIPVAANRWYLTSFPRKTDLNLYEFFSDSSALIYRWNNSESKYDSFVDSTLQAGEAVWLLSYQPRKFNLEKIPVSTDSDSVVVDLVKGWNQIGIPTGYHLNLGDSRFIPRTGGAVIDIREAVSRKLIAPAVYWYRSSALLPGYEWSDFDTTIASPWRGYWILAAEPGQFILPYQPVFPASVYRRNTLTNTDAARLAKTAAPDNWQLSLQLTSDQYADNGNIIGINPGRSGLPVYEPPHLDRYCSAFFPSEGEKITRDLRDPFISYEEVKTWDLIIESSSSGKQHTLSWPAAGNPDGIFLYLVDQVSEKIVDMTETTSYIFNMNSESRIFKVYATQDAAFEPKIIPLTFRLDQNYPNPFNPSTTIRFGVPESSAGKNIQLKIFNILGQEIKTLINNQIEPGYHEIRWDGTNNAGSRVSSGVYFCRVAGPGHSLVRKMVLIR